MAKRKKTGTALRRKAAPKRKASPPRTAGGAQAQDTADLKRLINDLVAARERGDTAAQDEATQGLIDFMTRPVSEELRNAADEARLAADNASMAQSLEALRGIAGRLAAAAPALDDATAIATQGKKQLFFPRLAKAAEEMLESVRKLKQAADELEAQLQGVDELGDLPMLLDHVRAQLEKLKARAKALQA